jgi:hypothetical protein
MKKLWLFIVLIAMSVTAWGQSGIFWDHEETGHGALVTQSVFATSMYLFTYGSERCDMKKEGIEPYCDLNGQRWFFGSNKVVDGVVRGHLYAASGLNFPDGIQDDVDPFVWHIGLTYAVGEYRMWPAGNGWTVEITHFKEDTLDKSPLDPDDPLFRAYEFWDVIATPD